VCFHKHFYFPERTTTEVLCNDVEERPAARPAPSSLEGGVQKLRPIDFLRSGIGLAQTRNTNQSVTGSARH